MTVPDIEQAIEQLDSYTAAKRIAAKAVLRANKLLHGESYTTEESIKRTFRVVEKQNRELE